MPSAFCRMHLGKVDVAPTRAAMICTVVEKSIVEQGEPYQQMYSRKIRLRYKVRVAFF